ncbi:hypothetical protein TWF696_006772 [Orbilia brochopaga]|uniref:Uncharacterized protein n=1 Tax=Orbilia brochopaga TaxID=3140254 RepID=A0AAV9UU67_9PEZI
MRPPAYYIWLTICLTIEFTKADWTDSIVKDWPEAGRRICLNKDYTNETRWGDLTAGCLDYELLDSGVAAGPSMGERFLDAPTFDYSTRTNPLWKVSGDVKAPTPGITDSSLGQIYQDYLVTISLIKSTSFDVNGTDACLWWWEKPTDYKPGDQTWDRQTQQALGIIYIYDCDNSPENLPSQQFVWRAYSDYWSKDGPDGKKVDINLMFAASSNAEHYCDRELDMWNIPEDQWETFINDNKIPTPLPAVNFRGLVWGCGKWFNWSTLEKYVDDDGMTLNDIPEAPLKNRTFGGGRPVRSSGKKGKPNPKQGRGMGRLRY